MPDQTKIERRYADIAADHGGMIARMAAAYEREPAARQDLEQDIHMHLWRSLAVFRDQCSPATWTWRVAHNVCARHVEMAARRRPANGWVVLDGTDLPDSRATPETVTDDRLTLERLYALIDRLRPADRQVVLLYLEDVDAAGIAEITGLTPGAVATRIHRIKALLARGFEKEAQP
ncbi:sigma-70 family RNA polymerase sigma factor [Devosia sp. PTR5]|uniref:Sigma-70 family RNA polymerase sigma factor n=1 Tax=Devosia oryzisoli TaxID=2774138 RepID=A0A927ISI9_9HYPH|nr:sigma-70 family RNA polymerase sigma factor [Devosia oryzisoli]MBD8065524.1 sigma-70 family RNA polymerase sigma factor [Devosia oryzisoli]